MALFQLFYLPAMIVPEESKENDEYDNHDITRLPLGQNEHFFLNAGLPKNICKTENFKFKFYSFFRLRNYTQLRCKNQKEVCKSKF
jgi:hypothetical protein